MGTLESEGLDSSISPSLPIPELIKIIRYSFHQSEFNEVQDILVGREQNMKFQLENLIQDRLSMKEEVRLLGRKHGLAELEKIKLEERLKKTDRENLELKEEIKRLTEEQNLCREREKRLEDQCMKLRVENSNLLTEKNNTISELMEKINQLKSNKSENEQLVVAYQEDPSALDAKLVQMEKEIEDLRHEKTTADQTVAEFKVMQLEADRKINELILEKLECDEAGKVNKRMLESLLPRITEVEKTLATVFNINIRDLNNLANEIKCSTAAQEGEHGNVPGTSSEEHCSGNGNAQSMETTQLLGDTDAENEFGMSPDVGFDFHSPKPEYNGFSGNV